MAVENKLSSKLIYQVYQLPSPWTEPMSAQNNGYIEGLGTSWILNAIRKICWVNTVLLLLADRLNFTPFSSNLNVT